ncbi:MAG: acyl-CoA dehydrogenase family protein [Candidatus Hodarchaeota archaeon]
MGNTLLNKEEKEFAAKFYDFLDKELDDDIKGLQTLNYFLEEETYNKKKEIIIRIMKKLAKKGYYSTIPKSYSYDVGPITRNAIIAFILCSGKWSVEHEKYIGGNWSIEMGRLAGGTLYCNPVNYKANENQKEIFLKPVAVDGEIAASAMTEFAAGSDIKNMELSIRDNGNEYVLNGKKIFITNGPIAKYILVYGRIDNAQMAAIIVDTKEQTLEGFEATRLHTFGMNDAIVSRLVFKDVKVPKENLLEGNGLDIAFHQLTEERLVISAEALGDVSKKLLYTHSYALQREQFSKKLHQYQVIRMPITTMVRQLSLLTDSLISYARLMDSSDKTIEDPRHLARQAMGLKIATTELAFESSIHCFRTMGGRGFIRQYSVPIGFLDAYCMVHGGGSNYVLQDSESRQIFKNL